MGTSLKSTLAQNIKIFRENSGMSQQELADKAKIKMGIIKSVETERAWPSAENLDAIAGALNVEPASLLIPKKIQDRRDSPLQRLQVLASLLPESELAAQLDILESRIRRLFSSKKKTEGAL